MRFLILFFLALSLGYHAYSIKLYLTDLVEISSKREMFLNTIKSSYTDLPQRVTFFTQSDTAYYGMPDNEKILPVQIGFGKMLMIWYQKDERFPGCLYEDQFLIKLLEQGYRFCEGRGFGYFRDYDKLVEVVRANRVPVANVISYSWDGKTQEFDDITEEIRQKIACDINLK